MNILFRTLHLEGLRLLDVIYSHDNNQTSQLFPKRISDLDFKKEIILSEKVNDYRYAVYTSDDGKKYFAKMWMGKRKLVSYYWLKNEIACYQSINSRVKHFKPDEKKLFKRVFIPKLIAVHEEKNVLILIIEFVKGKNIAHVNDSQAIKAYDQSLKYLSALNNYSKVLDKIQLTHIGLPYLIVSSPLIVLIAIYKCPKSIFLVLKAWLMFISGIPSLAQINSNYLTHKDLGENIVITKNGYCLFDFQVMSLTYKYLDDINIEIYHLGQEGFLTTFRQKIVASRVKTSIQKSVYRSLSAYSLIFNLGVTKNISFQTAEYYMKYIKQNYILKPKLV